MDERTGRYFFALSLDSVQIQFASALQQDLKSNSSGFRWVVPELMHITLLFMGAQNGHEIQRLKMRLHSRLNEKRAFCFTLGGVGAFPNLRQPRVLWLGVAEGSESMVDLAQVLSGEAIACGMVEPELRRFHPHITLGRAMKDRTASVNVPVYDKKNIISESMCATKVELFSSQLTSAGPVYTVVDTFFLKE